MYKLAGGSWALSWGRPQPYPRPAHLRCSTLSPDFPGKPTRAWQMPLSSTRSSTCRGQRQRAEACCGTIQLPHSFFIMQLPCS